MHYRIGNAIINMTEQEFLKQIDLNKSNINSICKLYFESYSRADLIQDIITELWKSLSSWKNNCKFSTWVNVVARNVCIAKLRKHTKQPKTEGLEDYENILQYVDNTPELIKQLHEAKRYNTVLNAIEEPYKTLFIMYAYGATYNELEQHSGITANALRVTMHRIKQKLRLRYGDKVIK